MSPSLAQPDEAVAMSPGAELPHPDRRRIVTHEEYLARVFSGKEHWGVTDYDRAIALTWGPVGTRRLRFASFCCLLPSIGYGIWSLWAHHPWGLIWAFLGTRGFGSGRPDLSCGGGCLWVLAALIGTVLSFTIAPRHFIGGLLPLVGYFCSSIMLGTTLNEMGGILLCSPEVFDRLAAEGIVCFAPKPSIDPTPSDEQPS